MKRYAGLHCNDAEARIKNLAITQSGDWSVSVNVTDETITAWEGLAGTTKWFEVYSPDLAKAWFVVAKVPAKIPVPEVSQNELLVMEISLTVQELYGTATKVAPTV